MMLLTITTTHQPATDLGYLLHKHPGRVQTFPLAFGAAHVFYPETSAARCTAALLLDVDPVGLVRRRGTAGGEAALAQYVSDRPYVASSFLSVAIGEVYGSALSGKSRERPELAELPLPLEARLVAVPCRGGEAALRRLFEPLGYTVELEGHALDERFPAWGESPYFSVTLRGEVRLRDLLLHLTVLIPVLDNAKHYWVGDDEVEKLLRRGEGWLATHPERAMIARRYLKRRQPLIRAALDRLRDEDKGTGERDEGTEESADAAEVAEAEERVSLNEQRLGTVLAALKGSGARRVLDLGCGEGRLLKALLDESQFEAIVGLDVSARALAIAADRLHLERLPERQRARIRLLHGSLTYRDARLAGYDAAALVEVIEHLEPERLGALERVVFGHARPGTVVVTTPNAEYNVRYENLATGTLRHADHRFEWTRAEFRAWAEAVAARFGYGVRHLPVGPDDAELGPPTQMAVFSLPA